MTVSYVSRSLALIALALFCVLLVCYSAPRAGAPRRPPVVISITSAGDVYMSNGMTEILLLPLLSYRCQAEPGSSLLASAALCPGDCSFSDSTHYENNWLLGSMV